MSDLVPPATTRAEPHPLERATQPAPPPPAEESSCRCIREIDTALEEKGFKLHPAWCSYVLSENKLTQKFYLPIVRLDGRPPRSGQPKGVQISHCPFCGKQLPT